MFEQVDALKRSRYDRFLDYLSQLSLLVAGIALVVLTLTFGWLVFGRYVLNSTPTWVEQLSLLLVVLIAFLGASVGIHKNTHLGVSFLRPQPLLVAAAIPANFATFSGHIWLRNDGKQLSTNAV